MVGIPGSGKTFFAEKFAETFHAPYLNRDRINKLVNDAALADKLVMLQFEEFLKTRQTLILEGPTGTRTERAEIIKLARHAGYAALFVWVQTDPIAAKMRSLRPAKESGYQAISSEEYNARLKRFSPPHAIEKPVVISGKHTYATQVRIVLKRLSGPRGDVSSQLRPPARPDTPTDQRQSRRNIAIS